MPRPGFRRLPSAAALALLLAAPATPASAQLLSEFVAHHAGGDTQEFVEIHGLPRVAYGAYTIVVLQGAAAANPGAVLQAYTAGTTDVNGTWTTGPLPQNSLPNGSMTLLLVQAFSGSVGSDLDPDDDGALDSTPWTLVKDAVAVDGGGGGDRAYAPALLAGGYDGDPAVPGGASRYPYGLDTDAATDWRRDDFDNGAFPAVTVGPGEAYVTPGSVNLVPLADYYAGIDPASPATLRASLNATIDDHVAFPYSLTGFTATWNILESADENPLDATRILDVYRNRSYVKVTQRSGGTGSGFYNREHTWPNSYGFNDVTTVSGLPCSPYTDTHMLYLSASDYNADRGNLPYAGCGPTCTERTTDLNNGEGGGSGTYPGNSNWFRGTTFEVWGARKGDMARAILYADLRYEGGAHGFTGQPEPDLVATDNPSLIVATPSGTLAATGYMGLLSTMIAWHLQDPPDARDRRRNDVVYSYQGNRNPFVDHPEWVACLYQGNCPTTDAPLPDGVARLELEQNRPNPFVGRTTMRFALPAASHARLEVFDLLGRRVAVVADGEFAAGWHTVDWNGRVGANGASAAGLYVLRLQAGGLSAQRKTVLLP